eukprot:366248-Chlamydomonas_euryale.AAC.7
MANSCLGSKRRRVTRRRLNAQTSAPKTPRPCLNVLFSVAQLDARASARTRTLHPSDRPSGAFVALRRSCEAMLRGMGLGPVRCGPRARRRRCVPAAAERATQRICSPAGATAGARLGLEKAPPRLGWFLWPWRRVAGWYMHALHGGVRAWMDAAAAPVCKASLSRRREWRSGGARRQPPRRTSACMAQTHQ